MDQGGEGLLTAAGDAAARSFSPRIINGDLSSAAASPNILDQQKVPSREDCWSHTTSLSSSSSWIMSDRPSVRYNERLQNGRGGPGGLRSETGEEGSLCKFAWQLEEELQLFGSEQGRR